MSDELVHQPPADALPAAFERELQRAERYAASALAPSTRKAYEGHSPRLRAGRRQEHVPPAR